MLFIDVRLNNQDVLISVSALHKKSLYWTLNSFLGEKQIQRTYAEFLIRPEFHLFVIKENNRAVSSAISFTENYRITRLSLRLIFNTVLQGIFKNPLELFKTALEQYMIRRSLPEGKFAFIYSWFTDFDSRNLGLGKTLMNACVSELSMRQVKDIYVDVSNLAPKSQEIYLKYGFTLYRDLHRCKILKYTITESSL